MTVARVVVAVLLALVLPLTVVRVAGVDVGHPVAALLAAFPWTVVLALVAVLVAVLAGWRLGTAVAATTALVGLALLAPRALPAAQPPADGPTLTVAVANLRVGGAEAEDVVAAVAAHDVDVLLTLELTEPAIARLRTAGLDDLLPHAVLTPSRLTSGGGLHARHPLTALPTASDRGFGSTPAAALDVPGHGTVELLGVHPLPPVGADWTGRWRTTLDALPAPATGQEPTRVLAGDLNATLDHAPLRRLLTSGWRDAAAARGRGLAPTFHGLPFGEPVPPVTLDHVLVDDRVAVGDVRVLPLGRSDHRLLVVRLRLPSVP